MPRGDIDDIARLEGAMKAKDEQLSSLRSQLAEKEKQLDGANESNSALSREIGGLKANIESLTAERDGINKNLEETRRLLREKTAKLAETEAHVVELESRDQAEQARLKREQDAIARREAEEIEDATEARRKAKLAAAEHEAEETEKTAAVRRKAEAKAKNRELVGKQVRASLISLAFMLAFFGGIFMWLGVELEIPTYIGTLVIVSLVCGLIPVIAEQVREMKEWADQGRRGLGICVILAATVGVLVAAHGVAGHGWLMWINRLMVFLGYGGYTFTVFYLLWRMPEGKSKWWGVYPIMAFLMVLAFFGGLVYHPISSGIQYGEWKIFQNKYISTPVEHLVNVGLWLAGLVLLTGILALIAAPGLELFRKKLGELPQKKRARSRWMRVATWLIFISAMVVAWLQARSLWPKDGDMSMIILALVVALIAFVGISWLTHRLFWAMEERKPFGWLLGMVLFVVFCTSLVSGSTFYEANSADDRLVALKADILKLQQDYYAAARPVAERYMGSTTSQETKNAFKVAISDMDKYMTETQAADNQEGVEVANAAFKKAGSVVKDRLNKGDEGLYDALIVPTPPSRMTLYLRSIGHLFGVADLPTGVGEVYPGALVMSVLMLFVTEFMLLTVFFAMWKSRGDGLEPRHDGVVIGRLYDDGTVAEALRQIEEAAATVAQPATATPSSSATAQQPAPAADPVETDREQGTRFLVTCPHGTDVGDELNVLGENDNSMIAVLRVSVQLGDEAFLCERRATKGMKPIPNGAFVRVV